jgi:hypothetical protein
MTTQEPYRYSTKANVLIVRADEIRLGDLIAWGGAAPIEVRSIAQMKPAGNVHVNCLPAFENTELEMSPEFKIRVERDREER